jgi:rhodanese-related sulfurtransferase
MWRTIQRSLLIVVASAGLGLAVNAISPKRIPYITPPKPVIAESEFIPLPEAFKMWASGAAFLLDARAPADYEAGHIAGAFSLPAEAFHEHFPAVAPYLTHGSSIVCYCDGMDCDLSHHLAELLRQQGYTNIHLLQNGWTVWRNAGHPTSTGPQP